MKDLRVNYTRGELEEDQAPKDPLTLFEQWFEEALNSEVAEPNAMVLSTVDRQSVDSRTVLLKGLRDQQFVFFTNYTSNKAKQLLENPDCTLLFVWLPLERQIKIRGKAAKVSEEESQQYFQSRPRESQIGAWVSDQSSSIASREELEKKKVDYTCEFEGKPIMKPDFWGGFEVTPYEIEFWQGRPSRLHDRLLYKQTSKGWEISRLQP